MEPSSYILFARKIKGLKWSKSHIRRKFLKQVDKGDYAKDELPELIEHLVMLTNTNFPIENRSKQA